MPLSFSFSLSLSLSLQLNEFAFRYFHLPCSPRTVPARSALTMVAMFSSACYEEIPQPRHQGWNGTYAHTNTHARALVHHSPTHTHTATQAHPRQVQCKNPPQGVARRSERASVCMCVCCAALALVHASRACSGAAGRRYVLTGPARVTYHLQLCFRAIQFSLLCTSQSVRLSPCL